ncbi:hypothetical protein EDB83DRAFT_2326009 [Lactarius deliciosus]|nr:hypothetical protein EDB83DRAFT_2326009 [Lactarius deliciosus]
MSRYQILENYVNDDESVAAYEQAEEHYTNEEDIEFNAAYEQPHTSRLPKTTSGLSVPIIKSNIPKNTKTTSMLSKALRLKIRKMAEEVLAEEEDPAEESQAEEGQEQYKDRLYYAEGDAETLEQAEDEDDTGLAAMPQMFDGDCERASAFMDSWDLWSRQLSPIFSQYQLATIFLSLFGDPVDQWAEERLAQIEEWRAMDMEDDDEDILEDTIGRFVEEFVPHDDAREQYVAAEDPDAEDWSSVDDEDPYSREVPSPPSLCSDDQASEEEPDEVNEYVEEPHGDAREEYGCQDEVDDYYYLDQVPAEADKEYEEDPTPYNAEQYFTEAAAERVTITWIVQRLPRLVKVEDAGPGRLAKRKSVGLKVDERRKQWAILLKDQDENYKYFLYCFRSASKVPARCQQGASKVMSWQPYSRSHIPKQETQRPDSESEERVTPVPRKQKKRKTQAVKQEPAKKKKTVRIAVEEDELPRAKLPPSTSWEKKFIAKFGKGWLDALREAGVPDYLIKADVLETPDTRMTTQEQVQELTELYFACPDLQDAMWNATVAPATEQASWKGPNTFSVPTYQAAPPDPTPASWRSADITAAQESRAAENTGWFAYQSNPDAMDMTAGRAYACNQAKCHHCWSTGHTRRNCPNRDAPRKRTWVQEYNDDDEDPLPHADSLLAAPRGRSPTIKPVHGSNVATYAPTTRYTPEPTRFVVQASPPQRRAATPLPSPISDVGFTHILLRSFWTYQSDLDLGPGDTQGVTKSSMMKEKSATCTTYSRELMTTKSVHTGQGAKAQEREGIPQDIKAKGFIRERPSTYTTRAGAFKPSNPNTQPQTLISQSNQRPYKSAVTSVTYHTPIRAQAHPDPSGPALGGSRTPRASRAQTQHIQHPSPVSPMTDEEFADRLADMQIRRMQAKLYGDMKKARDISMRMNLAEYAQSLNHPASVPRQRGRCSRRKGNVTVSPQTNPRAPYTRTPNTIRRRNPEDDAEEETEIRRLVAEHAQTRAKSPTSYYPPGGAQKPQEFWE